MPLFSSIYKPYYKQNNPTLPIILGQWLTTVPGSLVTYTIVYFTLFFLDMWCCFYD